MCIIVNEKDINIGDIRALEIRCDGPKDIIMVYDDIDYDDCSRDEMLSTLVKGSIDNVGFLIEQRNGHSPYMVASIKVNKNQLKDLIQGDGCIPRDIDYIQFKGEYAIIAWGYWHIVYDDISDNFGEEKPTLSEVLTDVIGLINEFD